MKENDISTLITGDGRDSVLSRADEEILVLCIAGSVPNAFQDAGHLVPWKYPTQVDAETTKLLGWLGWDAASRLVMTVGSAMWPGRVDSPASHQYVGQPGQGMNEAQDSVFAVLGLVHAPGIRGTEV